MPPRSGSRGSGKRPASSRARKPATRKPAARKTSTTRKPAGRKTSTTRKPAPRNPVARKTSTRKTATRKPAARKTSTTRKPAARSRPARAGAPAIPMNADPSEDQVSYERPDLPERPLAVGPNEPGAGDEAVTPEIPAAPEAPVDPFTPLPSEMGDGPEGPVFPGGAGEVERPGVELLIALAALGLALSVAFLPWYKTAAGGFDVTGWASGTWGPVILFLAVAAIGIVVLRRRGVDLSFPLHAPLVLEAIGWVSVLAILAKRWFRAEYPAGNDLNVGVGLWVGLLFAGAIALLGGRVSRDTPFVVRPGWHKGRAGTLGAAVLLVAIAAGAAFGLTNSFAPTRSFAGPDGGPTNVEQVQGYPSCAEKIPIPKGVEAVNGTMSAPGSEGAFCVASLTSDAKLSTVFNRYKAALEDAGWTYTPVDPVEGSRQIVLEKPECGQIVMGRNQAEGKKIQITVLTQSVCPSPMPSR